MSERTPGKSSNTPLIIILAIGGLVLLGAIGYGAMVLSGPMPGMGH